MKLHWALKLYYVILLQILIIRAANFAEKINNEKSANLMKMENMKILKENENKIKDIPEGPVQQFSMDVNRKNNFDNCLMGNCTRYLTGKFDFHEIVLKRKKRAIIFPQDSAVKFSIVLNKALIVSSPRGINLFEELDAFFPVPDSIEAWKPTKFSEQFHHTAHVNGEHKDKDPEPPNIPPEDDKNKNSDNDNLKMSQLPSGDPLDGNDNDQQTDDNGNQMDMMNNMMDMDSNIMGMTDAPDDDDSKNLDHNIWNTDEHYTPWLGSNANNNHWSPGSLPFSKNYIETGKIYATPPPGWKDDHDDDDDDDVNDKHHHDNSDIDNDHKSKYTIDLLPPHPEQPPSPLKNTTDMNSYTTSDSQDTAMDSKYKNYRRNDILKNKIDGWNNLNRKYSYMPLKNYNRYNQNPIYTKYRQPLYRQYNAYNNMHQSIPIHLNYPSLSFNPYQSNQTPYIRRQSWKSIPQQQKQQQSRQQQQQKYQTNSRTNDWRKKNWYYHRGHRERRYVYDEIEKFGSRFGFFNVKYCLKRTMCEVRNFLLPRGVSLFDDIFRVIFTLPHKEHWSDDYIDEARSNKTDCNTEFKSTCPVSILEFLLFSTRTNLKS